MYAITAVVFFVAITTAEDLNARKNRFLREVLKNPNETIEVIPRRDVPRLIAAVNALAPGQLDLAIELHQNLRQRALVELGIEAIKLGRLKKDINALDKEVSTYGNRASKLYKELCRDKETEFLAATIRKSVEKWKEQTRFPFLEGLFEKTNQHH